MLVNCLTDIASCLLNGETTAETAWQSWTIGGIAVPFGFLFDNNLEGIESHVEKMKTTESSRIISEPMEYEIVST